MRNLLDQEGPVMRALTDLSTLVILNILTLLFCIPVVTAGASLAAMHYVIIEMIEERGDRVLPEFWKRFRENLRNATPIWLILLAAALFLYADYRIIDSGVAGLPSWMLIPIYVGDPADSPVRLLDRGGFQECCHPGSGVFPQNHIDGGGDSSDPVLTF